MTKSRSHEKHGRSKYTNTETGCEGDLAAISVTPLIARVDWADLAGSGWGPLPPSPIQVHPSKAVLLVKEEELPN